MQDEQTIIPQNFKMAIWLGVLAIITLLIQSCCDQKSNAYYITLTINTIAYTWLLFCFKKYLENFKAEEAIGRTKWYIILNIAAALMGFSAIIVTNAGIGGTVKNIPGLFSGLLIIGLLIVIAIIILSILVGDSLRNIENDFVGLLKACGITTMILIPLVYVLIFVKGFMHFDEKFPEYSIPVRILFALMMDVPTLIMILIFARAEKRVMEMIAQ